MERLRLLGLVGLCSVLTGAQRVDPVRVDPERVDPVRVDPTTTLRPDRPASYLLLAPSEVCVGVPFRLSILVLTSDPLVQVSFELQGGSTSVYVVQAEGSYIKLQVRGSVGNRLLFTNSTSLRIAAPDISTFVQTDKPDYRPGETVRIRVVSIGPDQRPHHGPVDVFIKDPRGNLIRQWLSLNSTLGVVSQELQLSDFPPLGCWMIQTTVQDVESSHKFNVAHYVLPTFKVGISVPGVVYHRDILSGSVTAKYTYGKPVRGVMVVTYICESSGDSTTSVDMIDGSAKFELDLSVYFSEGKSSHGGLEDERGVVRVVVNVTETLTGLMYSSEAMVYLERSRYKISFECSPYVLKPSMNFTATMKISTYNGQPLTPEDQTKWVTVSVMQRESYIWEGANFLERRLANGSGDQDFYNGQDYEQEMHFLVPADGVIPLSIQIIQNIRTLELDASIEDTYEMLSLQSNYHSPSQSYLQIQKPSTPVQVGLPLWMSVRSNFETPDFFYTVKSRNGIVASGQGSGSLVLTPEASWAPMACVVVYCVRPDNEVVNDVLLLPVPLELRNRVSVTWSTGQAVPLEQVSLRLSVAESQSLVGLLVVDTATLRPGAHHDITTETVLEELLYGGMSEWHRPDHQTIGSPGSLFRSCGLVALTDATLNAAPIFDRERPMKVLEGVEGSHEEDEDEDEGPEPRVRQHFPETWLWMDVHTG
ncbi:hypothetical protein NHX12_026360 [Muraenolepis orangiensis]|uniref:Alpha-2-macroglobulin bait region domain-containing protein n=1 Tax=Muraenolepis orangiensis TaxID=630683 RepID=A0A9Q0EJD6_9TELE|nr:hypothetical protein NHX12_026360 [Muraenolepis orangiensis]